MMIRLKDVYPEVRGSYFLTSCGRVYSTYRGILKELSYIIDKDGYKNVFPKLEIDAHKTKTVRVGRAILLAFKGKGGEKETCDHIDRNRTNDFILNLRWLDYKGQANNRKKPDVGKNVKLISVYKGEIYLGDFYARDIVKKFNINRTSIYCVLSPNVRLRSIHGFKFKYAICND